MTNVRVGTLVWAAIGLFLLYGAYQVFVAGSPENKQFRDECYRQETRQYLPGSVPDSEINRAVAVCERRLRDKLGLR